MTDFNMLNILKKFNSVEKQNLNESTVTECGGMGPAPSTPVTVNLSAGSAGEMAMILRALSGIESGTGHSAVGLMASPMDDPDIPGQDDVPGDDDMQDGVLGGVAGAALGGMTAGIPGAIAGGYLGHKTQQAADKDESMEEWDNEPEEEYSDHKTMTKTLSGGINRQKQMFKKSQDGDNAMAVESIKDRLLKALAEAKAKPDFLDMDKDGNKKEPMKKAIADKKKKKVGEAKAKPDFLDMDKDGNKKEPMKKAIADKKKKAPVKEAEIAMPSHELDDTARKAMNIAQIIKRKINSGDQMDDRDYNQMAELGAVLSRFGTNFGPKSMKDVMAHMVQYTDDRNQEGHGYPEFNVDRFKELIAMAKSKGESMMGEISSDLAKRYTKAAKMDRDFNDDDITRLSKSGQSTRDMHRRNAKRTKGINRAAKRIDR